MALRLDVTCLVRGGPQGELGVDVADLDAAARRHGERLAALAAGRRAGKLGFFDLPEGREPLHQVEAYAAARRGRYESVVVLGIGGSALGTLALHAALSPPLHNLQRHPHHRPRLYVADNVDPTPVAPHS